jgi:hypothetical protein
MKCNLFIIGAAKSGSTSLAHYLGQHPDIFFSPVKETNHFSLEIDKSILSKHYLKHNHTDEDSYFKNQFPQELQLSIIQKPQHYAKLFKAGQGKKYRAEASVSYMHSPVAAKAIYEYNPNAKIIAILRQPAERAFSHYLMALRFGYTSLAFREAFEKDKNKPTKGWGISELFYELGLYHKQLLRYFELFPRENILVLRFEDLKSNPEKLLRTCFDFLNLNSTDIDTGQVYNPGEVPKNPGFNRLLYKTGLSKAASTVLPKSLIKKVKSRLLKSDKPTLTQEDKEYLNKLYAEEIEKTAKLTGLDLSHWLYKGEH